MERFDLVIFDFDGTLVNSEPLADRALAATIHEVLDLGMSVDDLVESYRGHTLDHILADLAVLHGSALPDTFFSSLNELYWQTVTDELEATPGAFDAVCALAPTPVCVATNSDRTAVVRALEITGLTDLFGRRVFCGPEMRHPKPAPDVYLAAADDLGVDPARCLVVEDSPLGARAGLSAGMTTVGFAGNHPEMAARLEALGIPVIFDLRELLPLVRPEPSGSPTGAPLGDPSEQPAS